MKIPRRRFLHLTAGAAALPATSHFAWAQAYPTRPVRIIVAAAPGGANDVVARLMATWLSERLGQFVVENRPGGSNNIGTEAAVRATPSAGRFVGCDQRDTLRQAQFYFSPRHYTNRQHSTPSLHLGGTSVSSGEYDSRAYRIRPGEPRQS